MGICVGIHMRRKHFGVLSECPKEKKQPFLEQIIAGENGKT